MPPRRNRVQDPKDQESRVQHGPYQGLNNHVQSAQQGFNLLWLGDIKCFQNFDNSSDLMNGFQIRAYKFSDQSVKSSVLKILRTTNSSALTKHSYWRKVRTTQDFSLAKTCGGSRIPNMGTKGHPEALSDRSESSDQSLAKLSDATSVPNVNFPMISSSEVSNGCCNAFNEKELKVNKACKALNATGHKLRVDVNDGQLYCSLRLVSCSLRLVLREGYRPDLMTSAMRRRFIKLERSVLMQRLSEIAKLLSSAVCCVVEVELRIVVEILVLAFV
ncbi:pentatricopeptide repeat-containing protein-like [Dorcoceras hygrometricum]|uniref:Pentatricopeptide repeat-containing protein-like n=1 Tax=Dorcoceras hygrometricum TaxID=472368 RepID=A0A2Z7B7Q7_9LAMI|nr:pentatricopeptide repeat-containing protein-like [Dorcoceras hygrometricum]